ncbi:MAG: sugar phosphate isomerase/epimerase [Clostridia bacterium]
MSKHLPIAYQLYSAREDMASNMEGTLAQLAHMGYQGVEFAGFYGRSAKDISKLMKKTGLTPMGSHISLEQIRENMHDVLDYHLELGCPYIAVPSLEEEARPGMSGFSQALHTLYLFGKLCKKHGISLLYHHHDFELVPFSGQLGLDFIMTAIPSALLQAELDCCWLKYAGLEPAEVIRKYARRCPLIHLHDFVQMGDKVTPILFKPVGYGCQNVAEILSAASESHVKWLVVEQDDSTERPALEDAKLSLDYLLGLRP